ncbi:hypothetical protein K438DRAFT_1979877 [Mycena galopus ATCC 62051]|nr:hypothetical protein K438DRAFT_1979877 [Mycena galopus ATCC 62051]
MPRLNTRWFSIFLALAAALLTLVAVAGWASFEEGANLQSKYNAFGVDVNSTDEANQFTNWTNSPLALAIDFSFDSFDPSKGSTALGFNLAYVPLNDLRAENVTQIGVLQTPTVPVRLVLQSVTNDFQANSVMVASVGQTQVLNGDVNRYSFDVFTIEYDIYAFTSPSNTTYGSPLPLTIYAAGAVQGFKIETTFRALADDGSGVRISTTVSRSPITKAFAVIIILVMWCLSGGVFTVAISVWFQGRKADTSLIAMATGLLFALPSVRNSQPGIPVVAGTTSDMIGFFFNVVLVAASAFSLVVNYIIKNRRGPVTDTKLPV